MGVRRYQKRKVIPVEKRKPNPNATISGHMIVKNGVKFDYPFIEAALSVLPICDEFIFVEGTGDDGTYEKILEAQAANPKIKVFREKWDKEHYDVLSDLTNIAIEKCTGDYHWQVQADECVHERYLPAIQDACRNGFDMCYFGVYHFFSNFDTIYRPGVFYDSFIRLAHKETYPRLRSYSDAMSLGTPEYDPALFHQVHLEDIKIFHYGYVRKPKHLIEKQKQMTRWWGYLELDQYLADGEASGAINWLQKHKKESLRPFPDTHPAVIQEWIKEREELVRTGRTCE